MILGFPKTIYDDFLPHFIDRNPHYFCDTKVYDNLNVMFAKALKAVLNLPILTHLPRTATGPFCPSEAQDSIGVPNSPPWWKKFMAFAGPGLIISVGYMDPGNWATDIEAGSKYHFAFLFVVLFSSAAAVLLQCLSMRLGLVAKKDLAVLCRENFAPRTNILLWIFAELAIIATDVAEVLGSALAFLLLFGIPLQYGVFLTALDTVIVLALKGKGFRRLEALILGLVLTIGICFIIELYWLKPQWSEVWLGFIPKASNFNSWDKLYLAVGILGATVMPHNLYLHSSIIQTRKIAGTDQSKSSALKYATLDTSLSLFVAFLINAGILVLAASAFYSQGHFAVTGIDNAYHLLEPIGGGRLASILFGVALLASGQSSTFTGTIAGQTILDGFLQLKIPCWQRRVITRGLALIPALIGVSIMGKEGVGKLLIISQVVLSLQLPFAIYPLIIFNHSKRIMGNFASRAFLHGGGWFLFLLISGANLLLLYGLIF